MKPETLKPAVSSPGWSGKVVLGVMAPESRAADAVTTFMIEPGVYTPWRARSMSGLPAFACSAAIGAVAVLGSPEMGVALKVGADVMARMAPVRGSIATMAPAVPASCLAAKSWSRLSMVRVRSLGSGWRPTMSSKTSRSGFGSARPVSRSS